MFFSQRKGLRPSKKLLQLEAVDQELRNALWSYFHEYFLRNYRGRNNFPHGPLPVVRGSNMESFFVALWNSYFKKSTDTIPRGIDDAINILRVHFYKAPWFSVYDLLEFVLAQVPADQGDALRKEWNLMLERENSGYRIVNARVVEITNENELAEVVSATALPIEGASHHIATAIALLSDRKNPDYRNSIKESISAIETICR